MKKRYLIIRSEIPEDLTAEDAKVYAQDALESWGGQYNPYDPRFLGLRSPISRMRMEKEGN